MQEPLRVSNQLLFGLFFETNRPFCRKRKISMSDSEDEESFSFERVTPTHRIEIKAEGALGSFPGMRLIQRGSEVMLENEFK